MSRRPSGPTSPKRNTPGPWRPSRSASVDMERPPRANSRTPMRRRLLTALALAVVGMPAIIFGGPYIFVVLGTFIVGAAWEYVRLFRAVGVRLPMLLVMGGVACILAFRTFLPEAAPPVFAGLTLAALAY